MEKMLETTFGFRVYGLANLPTMKQMDNEMDGGYNGSCRDL